MFQNHKYTSGIEFIFFYNPLRLQHCQKDALIKAVVNEDRIYFDMASGKRDDRPGNTLNCVKIR